MPKQQTKLGNRIGELIFWTLIAVVLLGIAWPAVLLVLIVPAFIFGGVILAITIFIMKFWWLLIIGALLYWYLKNRARA